MSEPIYDMRACQVGVTSYESIHFELNPIRDNLANGSSPSTKPEFKKGFCWRMSKWYQVGICPEFSTRHQTSSKWLALEWW